MPPTLLALPWSPASPSPDETRIPAADADRSAAVGAGLAISALPVSALPVSALPVSALPISARAERLLAQALLAPALHSPPLSWAGDPPEEVRSHCRRALGADPALAVWTASIAVDAALSSGGDPVADLLDLPGALALAVCSGRLASRVLPFGQALAGGDDPTLSPSLRSRWRRLARRSFAAAWMARHATSQAARSEDRSLAALIHNALRWVTRDDSSTEPPDALRCLSEAIQQLRRQEPALSAAIDAAGESSARWPAAAATSARRQTRRWLAGLASGGLLPRLVPRLALAAASAADLERQKLEAMVEFAAGAGHEINNPLAVISGRAQLLLRNETHPERRRDLSLIYAQARRVYEMIADLMLFARPPAPRFEPLSLDALLADISNEWRASRQETPTELSWSVEPAMRESPLAEAASPATSGEAAADPSAESSPWRIVADRQHLAVLLRALWDNAQHAMQGTGAIETQLRLVGGEAGSGPGVELIVSDRGPGVPPEIARHLFEPYFSGRESGRGLGLGLSKCWRIVQMHGGRIEVQDRPGGGATFVVWLPRRPPAAGGSPAIQR